MSSGCWRDVAVFGGARSAHAPARTGRFNLVIVVGGIVAADGWRKDVEGNAFVIGGLARRAVHPLGAVLAVSVFPGIAAGPITVLAAVASIPAIVAFRSLGAFAACWTLEAVLVVAAVSLAVVGRIQHFLVGIFVVGIIPALAALFLEPGSAFAQHPEIMVCELQIIFGLDAVPAELRIARHALVFFEQLGGIAALPIVLAIAVRPSAGTLGPLPAAAATAATLSIIDQFVTSLIKKTLPPGLKRDQSGAQRKLLGGSDPFVPVLRFFAL